VINCDILSRTVSELSQLIVQISDTLRFWALPLGMVDFLLVLIELFLLDATAEALRANIDWNPTISLQRGPVDPKFKVEGVALHQPFFFSENYRLSAYFVRYKNMGT